MQGHMFEAKVLVLPLDNYDLVLGVQWLVDLGDIVWNFRKLQMKFQIDDKEFVLQGDQVLGYSLTIVSSGKLRKVLGKIAQVSMVKCFSLKVNGVMTENLQEDTEKIPLVLQQILLNFKDVFEKLKGLPPCRGQDHMIILQEGAQLINCRHYRYGAL